ncbi:MAG: hypothetical protein KBD01_10040 [Acidobacteria bacterium]|nr:hypothetical protein [Acidobacteriota bacterium]
MLSRSFRPLIVSFALGLGVFLLLQLLLVLTWELVFAWAEVHEPWFLNSGKALVSSCAFIFICTVVILLARRRSSIADVLALTAGIVLGSAIVLVSLGAGNIWPLVLIFGSVLCTVSVVLGAAVAFGVRRLCGGPWPDLS